MRNPDICPRCLELVQSDRECNVCMCEYNSLAVEMVIKAMERPVVKREEEPVDGTEPRQLLLA